MPYQFFFCVSSVNNFSNNPRLPAFFAGKKGSEIKLISSDLKKRMSFLSASLLQWEFVSFCLRQALRKYLTASLFLFYGLVGYAFFVCLMQKFSPVPRPYWKRKLNRRSLRVSQISTHLNDSHVVVVAFSYGAFATPHVVLCPLLGLVMK